MPIQPITITPKSNTGVNGHVVSTTDNITYKNVVIQQDTPPEVKEVYDNLDVIKSLATHILQIVGVNNMQTNIVSVLALKTQIEAILAKSNEINTLSSIAPSLSIVASNINAITNVVNNIDKISSLNNISVDIEGLYRVRDSIVQLNTIKSKIENLDANLTILENVNRLEPEITLCYQHMLAIEIVAQNIEFLKKLYANYSVFEQLLAMSDTLESMVANIDVITKLANIQDELPTILENFNSNLVVLKNNYIEELNNKIIEHNLEIKEVILRWVESSLAIKQSILDVDKALSDYKVEVTNEFILTKENILNVRQELQTNIDNTYANLNNKILALTGKDLDTLLDLTQYLVDYYTKIEIDEKLNNIYTKAEVDEKFVQSNIVSTQELVEALSIKANVQDVYTKEEVNNKITEIDNRITEVDNKITEVDTKHTTKEEELERKDNELSARIDDVYTKQESDDKFETKEDFINSLDWIETKTQVVQYPSINKTSMPVGSKVIQYNSSTATGDITASGEIIGYVDETNSLIIKLDEGSNAFIKDYKTSINNTSPYTIKNINPVEISREIDYLTTAEIEAIRQDLTNKDTEINNKFDSYYTKDEVIAEINKIKENIEKTNNSSSNVVGYNGNRITYPKENN